MHTALSALEFQQNNNSGSDGTAAKRRPVNDPYGQVTHISTFEIAAEGPTDDSGGSSNDRSMEEIGRRGAQAV